MMRLPPEPQAFDRVIWLIVGQVPPGRVTTYGQIASMLRPAPSLDPAEFAKLAPYWVGQTMNRVRTEDTLPWQRVIGGQGQVAMPAGSPGALEQRRRLEAEGVPFDSRERVDLATFGWDGPPAAWLAEHDLLPPRPLAAAKPASQDDSPGQQQLSLF